MKTEQSDVEKENLPCIKHIHPVAHRAETCCTVYSHVVVIGPLLVMLHHLDRKKFLLHSTYYTIMFLLELFTYYTVNFVSTFEMMPFFLSTYLCYTTMFFNLFPISSTCYVDFLISFYILWRFFSYSSNYYTMILFRHITFFSAVLTVYTITFSIFSTYYFMPFFLVFDILQLSHTALCLSLYKQPNKTKNLIQ